MKHVAPRLIQRFIQQRPSKFLDIKHNKKLKVGQDEVEDAMREGDFDKMQKNKNNPSTEHQAVCILFIQFNFNSFNSFY